MAIDQSKSISKKQMKWQLKLAEELVDVLHIGEDAARISIFGFSGTLEPIVPSEPGNFADTETYSKKSIMNSLSDYKKHAADLKPNTDFELVFETASKMPESENNVLMIISDGYHVTGSLKREYGCKQRLKLALCFIKKWSWMAGCCEAL